MLKKFLLLATALLVFSGAALGQGTTGTTTAASTEKPAKPAAFRATKDQIKQGQQILINGKLYSGEATGVYGDSRPAIKSYQKANGLDENGKFDKATLEKMGIALTDKQKGIATTETTKSKTTGSSTTGATNAKATSTGDGPKRPAPFQANKDQITALQNKLKDAKLFTGEANGERSDALKDAIKKYQEANDLNATGGVNAATLGKLGIALTDKQKEQVAAQAAYDAAKAPKN
ncbi:MAG TPA: peptidoglycan-binding domain-containing protein [Pyrinomonadaceae bacterium]|mgnify:CR=1 FL=1|nr:peptidoglycan-binding protein [Chloracidobacterium sp.]MBP9935100.1 peptidoglycan-binding protein [Pyrinomonadaceae bacterium]MBK7803474.1 peptidoglycan-binding protein [Chloracidobacterium sp.]MBK9438723.1 peptidoglycan-binding protein [Chloracidobacterium sp.]MBK9766783.1 peptidoglycan-binding protein [Chloracidobacterium sp.]